MKIGSEEAQFGELPNTATSKRLAMSLCRCFLACFMGCGIQPIQSVQELDWFKSHRANGLQRKWKCVLSRENALQTHQMRIEIGVEPLTQR